MTGVQTCALPISLNTAVGYRTQLSNTTGQYNTSLGAQALYSNTTASYNTAVGYRAGYTNITGTDNTYLGYQAGQVATGGSNTFVGRTSGANITSGQKNTILGRFDGNSGGLDIRTASNYIVLSDGDGNPNAYCNNARWFFGLGGTASSESGGVVQLSGSSATGYQPVVIAKGNGTQYWVVGTKGWMDSSTSTYLQCMNTSGGVYLNGASATS